MEKRLFFEWEPDAGSHRVELDLRARGLQWPGRMVDLPPLHSRSLVERIQAVSLGQPALEGPLAVRELIADCRVDAVELSGRTVGGDAAASHMEHALALDQRHPGAEVRQSVGSPGP